MSQEQPSNDLDKAMKAGFGDRMRGPSSSVLQELQARAASSVLGVHLPDVEGREETSPPIKANPESKALHDPRGRYQVVGEIARGGMGIVFKGRDVDLGRDVAMKVLHEKYEGDSQVLERFVEEAQIGGQLQHPGIVPVYELGLQSRRAAVLRHEAGEGTRLSPHSSARRSRWPTAMNRRRLPGRLRTGVSDDRLCPRPPGRAP